MSQSRQLAAIMFTDIVGYTTLMGKDSAKALELVRISKEIQKPLVEKHHGQWLKEMGDGALAKFGTALDALNCAIEIQELARAKFDGKLRIGIHLGDITIENNDVYGDGVNVASRLESIADPGGIYISDNVEKSIRGQTDVQAKYLGEVNLKNVDYGVRTYAIQGVGLPVPEVKEDKELSGHFWAEVQRRGIIRAAISYLVVALLLVLLWDKVQDLGVILPGWSYTLLLATLGIGFPFALYLAWNYERSPEGLVRTSSQQSWQNPYSVSQRKPLTSKFFIAVVIVFMAGMYIYPRYLSPIETVTESIADEKSIAVLPLDVIGGDPEGEYFAAGVREEILNHLSMLEDLHVKSRSVVDRMDERTVTTQELVSELKLSHYLEGSAQKVDDQIRITLQLIDAHTNDHIWSENYDRNYENLLATQSEIAKKVAEALRITITPQVARVIDKRPTNNSKAWDDYLRAKFHWNRFHSLRKPEELKQTVNFVNASISKDPNFALGYSFLALAYQQVPGDPDIVFDFINPDSVLILCNRAIEIDPSLSDPYVTRALYYKSTDTTSAIRDFEQAISNGPHLPRPYLRYGLFNLLQRWDVSTAIELFFQGVRRQPEPYLLAQLLQGIGACYLWVADYQKAENYHDKALVYGPQNIFLLLRASQVYIVTGQFDEVLKLAEKIMKVSPNNLGLWMLGAYYLLIKDYAKSVDYFEEYFANASETALKGTLDENHMFGYALLKTGRIKEGYQKLDFTLNHISERGDGLTPDYEFAKIYSAKGRIDSAYYHLEKAVAGHIHWGMSDFMERDPLFENIKDEPEFQRLVKIARQKVWKKREEVRKLEESGVIPKSLDELELY